MDNVSLKYDRWLNKFDTCVQNQQCFRIRPRSFLYEGHLISFIYYYYYYLLKLILNSIF
jgi:hypothetical protein